MANDAVDLSARTGGLLPFWLFLLFVILWLVAVLLAVRHRTGPGDRLSNGLIAGGALALGNALFFWRPLFTDAHVPRGGGDLNSFFFTLHAYSAERLNAGELPLWNPTLHGGMPHLGNFQAGFLYPPNLIAYLVANPFSYGTLEWLAILHYAVASIGLYLLLRSLGAGRIGAVTGGLIFAYSGFMVAHLGHYSMISAAAWVPWLFWAVHGLARFPSWRRAALLGILVFLTAAAGHQQTLMFALGGSGLWWLFLTLHGAGIRIPGIGPEFDPETNQTAWNRLASRPGVTSVAQFAAAIVAGLALVAPMLLPSLQLARRSVRSSLTYEQASEFSVQPVALLQLFLPTVFGSNPTDYWGHFSSGEIWGYAGAVTLVLAATAMLLRFTAHRAFFALLALLALLYALGPWSPVHGWFYGFVPFFDLVRAPARSYLYLNLAMAVLAGLAVSDLAERLPQPGVHFQRTFRRVLHALLAITAVLALLVIPYFYTQILGVADPPNRPVITVDNLWTLLLFLSLLLATLWLARLRYLREAALGAVLVALITLDLFSATMPFNPVDEDLVASYREPEIAAFLQEQWASDGPFRIDVRHPGLLPNYGAIDGLHVATGVFDPMQPVAYTALHDTLAENPDTAQYDMLNVRYWILPEDEEAPDGFETAFESSTGPVVWEREAALSRAWFVSEVEDLEGGDALTIIRESGFDPGESVLIDEPPLVPDGGASGTVEVVEYEAERIVVGVDVDDEGYLVLSEGDYPGWQVTVDGEEADLLTANYGLRAVAVNAGTSEVELSYQPYLATFGFIAAGLGMLVLGGMIVLPGVFTVRRRPDEEGEGIAGGERG